MFDCYVCFVFTVSPPFLLSPVDPADYTAAAYDYVVDDSTTTVELPGKQSHSATPALLHGLHATPTPASLLGELSSSFLLIFFL